MISTPIFPSELPDVWNNSGNPNPQVIFTQDDAAPMALRRISRVPSLQSQIGWTFLEGEYKVFVTFWRDTLLNGHKWFYLRLPTAMGMQYCIVRVSDNTYTANQTGFRKWDVTMNVYVRERWIGGSDVGPIAPGEDLPSIVVDFTGIAVTNDIAVSAPTFIDYGSAGDTDPGAIPIFRGSPVNAVQRPALPYTWNPSDNYDDILFVGPGYTATMEVTMSGFTGDVTGLSYVLVSGTFSINAIAQTGSTFTFEITNLTDDDEGIVETMVYLVVTDSLGHSGSYGLNLFDFA